jgi:hypothetical protein
MLLLDVAVIGKKAAIRPHWTESHGRSAAFARFAGATTPWGAVIGAIPEQTEMP